ncbi:hypothetical protein FKM82_030486 [Ascaphus truei]
MAAVADFLWGFFVCFSGCFFRTAKAKCLVLGSVFILSMIKSRGFFYAAVLSLEITAFLHVLITLHMNANLNDLYTQALRSCLLS